MVDNKEEDESAAASAANEEDLKFSLENEADEDEVIRVEEFRNELEAAVDEESEQRERLEKATGVSQPRPSMPTSAEWHLMECDRKRPPR